MTEMEHAARVKLWDSIYKWATGNLTEKMAAVVDVERILEEERRKARMDALAEADACCQEVIDDRKENGWKMLTGPNKTVPKQLVVDGQRSGAVSCQARIRQKLEATRI